MDESRLQVFAEEVTIITETDTSRVQEFWEALTADPSASIAATRLTFDRLCRQFQLPEDAEVEHVDANGVACLLITAPGSARSRVAVWFHSGGYCIGSAVANTEWAYRVSRAIGGSVLLPDYRLAPEHPFPAALEDAEAAYLWAQESPHVDEVTLMGDSAGGGLAIALGVSLRDKGLRLPIAIVAFSPLTDLAGLGESVTSRAHLDPIPFRGMVAEFGAAYLAGRDPKTTPLASPLYADLSGLPPTLVQVGTNESLYDDSSRIVRQMARAGTDAHLLVAEGMTHIWPLFPFLAQSDVAMAHVGAFVEARRGK